MNPERKIQLPKSIRNVVSAGLAALALSSVSSKAENSNKDFDKNPVKIEKLRSIPHDGQASYDVKKEELNKLFKDVLLETPLYSNSEENVTAIVDGLKENFDGRFLFRREVISTWTGFETFCRIFEEDCNKISNPESYVDYQDTFTDENLKYLTKLHIQRKLDFREMSDIEKRGVTDFWEASDMGDCEDFVLSMMKLLSMGKEGEDNVRFSPLNMKLVVVNKLLKTNDGKIIFENNNPKYEGHAVLALELRFDDIGVETLLFDVNSQMPLTLNQFFTDTVEDGQVYPDHILRGSLEPVLVEGKYRVLPFTASLNELSE